MFRSLHYLNEVYKEQSFSRAAQKLYISQPSLSLTIIKFEREIGIQIFDRSTTPIQLTAAGKVYMEGIQRILAIENELEAYLDDYKELKTGSLTLGAPHLFSSYMLPALIAQFSKHFPMVEIRLVEADFLTLHDMTLNGEIDLLIESNQFDETLFQNYQLFREHVLLAVPCSDPVNEQLKDYCLSMEDIRSDLHMDSDRPCISLRNFQKHRFLMVKKRYDMHSRAMSLCQKSGFEPQVFMFLDQLMTVYNMVNQQLGVSFVTDTIVKLSNAGTNVVFYKIDDEQTTRYINLTHKLNRYVSRPMSEFIRMMAAISVGGITAVTSQQQWK
ncbi:LysR family transcriptional regulator [Paenibacillus sp. WQ 127069]|uniref:LysR family transcriptional regulator n=1 Tax=Paenibacillus baimaensis TaxID=2982185 RepID=A0ABT2UEF8_9BACL|nr:LysR family transcriptional regulator [Paenibacillus sp. WQ 127069]MCU6792516.1 LysR family transcriptional regulator [Paenibacillus sp. WQ 127069]